MFIKQRLVNRAHLSIESGRHKISVKLTCGGVAEFKMTHYQKGRPVVDAEHRCRHKNALVVMGTRRAWGCSGVGFYGGVSKI